MIKERTVVIMDEFKWYNDDFQNNSNSSGNTGNSEQNQEETYGGYYEQPKKK